ncbi:MAG: O-methyltransferase [Acidobacteriota bacterium]
MPSSQIADNPEELWAAVDSYLDKLLLSPDPLLQQALDASNAAGLPAISVSPLQGKLLQIMAQAQSARRILEIGALGGYSTIHLARALPTGGRLITLELEPRHAEVALANIARAGLSHAVTLRLGPALDYLLQLQAERRASFNFEPFDMVFLDADKPGYPHYLAAFLPLCRPGTLILADNVIREGKVIDASSSDPNVQGVREFLQMLADDPRLSSAAVQSVGSKGYDGFSISRVLSL